MQELLPVLGDIERAGPIGLYAQRYRAGHQASPDQVQGRRNVGREPTPQMSPDILPGDGDHIVCRPCLREKTPVPKRRQKLVLQAELICYLSILASARLFRSRLSMFPRFGY